MTLHTYHVGFPPHFALWKHQVSLGPFPLPGNRAPIVTAPAVTNRMESRVSPRRCVSAPSYPLESAPVAVPVTVTPAPGLKDRIRLLFLETPRLHAYLHPRVYALMKNVKQTLHALNSSHLDSP